MNTDTGRIYAPEQMKVLFGDATPEEVKKYKEMLVPPTRKQALRWPPRVGRNEPGPCGSGKKFKRCCYTGAESAKEKP